MTNKLNKKKQGFTIIELMVTLTIAGILLAYGVPSYREFSIRQNVTNESNDLLSDITYARVTAIKEGQEVSVTSNSNNDWSDGWVITLDDSNVTLREKQETNKDVSFEGDNGLITFNNIGNAKAINSIRVSHSGTTKSVTIDVAMSGMVTTRN